MEEPILETENVVEQTSLFSYLHDLRIERGVELNRLAAILGIPDDLIEAIEKGDRSKLPSDAYILGVAKKYAQHFKVPYQAMEDIWRAESNHLVSGRRDTLPQNRFIAPRRFWLSSLRVSVGIVLFLFVFGYLATQLFRAMSPVNIAVNDLPTVSSESLIRVSGTVSGRLKTLYLNSRQLQVEGRDFSVEVWLVPGPNIIRLVAENYFGASSTLEKIVVYQE